MKWVRIVGILSGLVVIGMGMYTYNLYYILSGGDIKDSEWILIVIAGIFLIIVALLPWKRILNR